MIQNLIRDFWLIDCSTNTQSMYVITSSQLAKKVSSGIKERMFFNVSKQVKHTFFILDVVSTKPTYIVKMQTFEIDWCLQAIVSLLFEGHSCPANKMDCPVLQPASKVLDEMPKFLMKIFLLWWKAFLKHWTFFSPSNFH